MDIQIWPSVLLRIALAMFCGGVIGMERQSKHRPAGFRTHILVCLGSMTIMILSELIVKRQFIEYQAVSDPARMAAQVISGIGFLGAGTIIHYGANVRGLTTAASLWAVAAIGLTVGAGFYFLAFVVTCSIYAILFAFNVFSRKMNDAGNILELMVHLINKPKTLGAVNLIIAKSNAQILDMEFLNTPDKSSLDESGNAVIAVHIVAKMPLGSEFSTLMQDIEKVNGVVSVERI